MLDLLVPAAVCLAGPLVALALVVIAGLTGTELSLAPPPSAADAAGRRPTGSPGPGGDLARRAVAGPRTGSAPRPVPLLLNVSKRTEPSHG